MAILRKNIIMIISRMNLLSFDKKVSKLKALGEETDKIMDIRRIIYNELKTASSRETIEVGTKYYM